MPVPQPRSLRIRQVATFLPPDVKGRDTSSVPQQTLPVWRSTPSCWLGSPSQKNWGLLTMINGIGKIRLRWIRKMGRWRAWFLWIGSEEDWEQLTVTNFISPYFNLSLLYWTYLMLLPCQGHRNPNWLHSTANSVLSLLAPWAEIHRVDQGLPLENILPLFFLLSRSSFFPAFSYLTGP